MTLSPSRPLLALAAISGFTAVLLGAMGAHGPVHDMLVTAGKLESWETGVRYHLPHSMFLYVLALFLGGAGRCSKVAWTLVFAGMLLFSGSIYLLASQGWKWLGPVTPFGGLLLMIGWLVLAIASWKKA